MPPMVIDAISVVLAFYVIGLAAIIYHNTTIGGITKLYTLAKEAAVEQASRASSAEQAMLHELLCHTSGIHGQRDPAIVVHLHMVDRPRLQIYGGNTEVEYLPWDEASAVRMRAEVFEYMPIDLCMERRVPWYVLRNRGPNVLRTAVRGMTDAVGRAVSERLRPQMELAVSAHLREIGAKL